MLKYDTFVGRDLQEAMGKLKSQLGPDAVVLKTQVVKPGGMLGFLRRPMIEVVGFRSDKKVLDERTKRIHEKETKNAGLQKELDEIKQQLSSLAMQQAGNAPAVVAAESRNGFFTRWENMLLDNEIGEELTEKIMDSLYKEIDEEDRDNDRLICDTIKSKLVDLIDVADPIKSKSKGPHVFMFVGPTGVGKTTTLVKLAASYKLKEEKEIEIFSMDNYRIAAMEQLKSYAEIMQIPFHKFDNKLDFKNALKKSKSEVILIDTAGRSPEDGMSISAIRDYQKSINFHNLETFLVVSASTKKKDLLYIDEKYSLLNHKYMLFTKLDETMHPGSIIDSLHAIKKPLTYVTFGQDVPKHISLANPETLVESILKEN